MSAWLRTAYRAVSVTRLEPFDVATPEGRHLERYRRVGLSFLSAGLARGVSILAALVVVPLAVRYLGDTRYGIWATITAVAGLIGFADLGLGSGLVSEIAAASGRDDAGKIARATSTAFFLLAFVAAVLGLSFAVAYRWIPWDAVFNTPRAAAYGAGAATAVFLASYLVSLPLGVAQRVHLGYQEMFVSSLWQTGGGVLSLAGVVAAIVSGASLPWVVLAAAGAPVVALAGNSVVLFWHGRTWLRPSVSRVSRRAAVGLLRIGGMFFVLQVAMAAAFESDTIVLAQILGPPAVTVYSVTMRVFLVVPAVVGFALTPLWPAYGEAVARGDVAWVQRALRRSVVAAASVALVPVIFLVAFGGPLIHAWSGAPNPPLSLLFAAGAWTVTIPVASALSAFLNGARIVRFQVVAALVMLTVNLALSIVLTKWIGVSGVVWASVVAQWSVVLAPSPIVVRAALRRLRAQDAAVRSAGGGG